MRRAAVAASVLVAALGSGTARAKNPVAEGRYHLRKANTLAGEDHCRAAIHEYALAYAKLHDPFVLFNRGECYRRVGEDAKAAADYRAFLEAVPAAPNRAEVEAKIVALTAAPVSAPARPVSAAAPVPATPPAGADKPTLTPPVAAAPGAAPPAVVTPVPETQPPASALVVTPAPVEAPATAADEGHGRSWMWVAALGAAVAGGAVGAYVALRSPATTPPTTALGNYKF